MQIALGDDRVAPVHSLGPTRLPARCLPRPPQRLDRPALAMEDRAMIRAWARSQRRVIACRALQQRAELGDQGEGPAFVVLRRARLQPYEAAREVDLRPRERQDLRALYLGTERENQPLPWSDRAGSRRVSRDHPLGFHPPSRIIIRIQSSIRLAWRAFRCKQTRN